MSEVLIHFNTDNAAFMDNWELEIDLITLQLRRALLNKEDSIVLRDSNGNPVGLVTYE